MILKIITKVGEPPIVLDAAAFVAYQANGTPIAAAGEHGPDGAQAVSCVGNKDFSRVLQMLGVNTTVVVHSLQLPKPQPGARLVAGPAQ